MILKEKKGGAFCIAYRSWLRRLAWTTGSPSYTHENRAFRKVLQVHVRWTWGRWIMTKSWIRYGPSASSLSLALHFRLRQRVMTCPLHGSRHHRYLSLCGSHLSHIFSPPYHIYKHMYIYRKYLSILRLSKQTILKTIE